MKPCWLAPILAAAIALSVAACAVAPDRVEPASVSLANYATMNCGELRYALYRAEARVSIAGRNQNLRGIEVQAEDTARTLSAEPWRMGAIALIWPMAIAYNMYTPLFIAADQQSAVAALSQAKGEVDALHQLFDTQGCTKWPAGIGAEIARFQCAFRVYDSQDGDRPQATSVPSPFTSQRVALILYERAIAYPDEPGIAPTAGTTTVAEIIDVSSSAPPGAAGRLTVVTRDDSRFPGAFGRDVFELRADDCRPLPAADIARANALFRDRFASLAR